MLSTMPRCLFPILLCLLAPACTYFESSEQVFVTSTPAGAEIHLDGEDTGLTTPATLQFDEWIHSDHELTVRKAGHDPEVRQIQAHNTGYTSRWIDGLPGDVVSYPWPLFWTLGDVFTPFARRREYTPRTLHVRLYKAGESPGTGR